MNVASFTDAAYEQALSALAAFTREPEKMKAAEGQSETAAIELKNVLQTNMEVLAAFPEYGAAWAGTLEGCSDYSGAALEKLIGRLEEETSELSGIKKEVDAALSKANPVLEGFPHLRSAIERQLKQVKHGATVDDIRQAATELRASFETMSKDGFVAMSQRIETTGEKASRSPYAFVRDFGAQCREQARDCMGDLGALKNLFALHEKNEALLGMLDGHLSGLTNCAKWAGMTHPSQDAEAAREAISQLKKFNENSVNTVSTWNDRATNKLKTLGPGDVSLKLCFAGCVVFILSFLLGLWFCWGWQGVSRFNWFAEILLRFLGSAYFLILAGGLGFTVGMPFDPGERWDKLAGFITGIVLFFFSCLVAQFSEKSAGPIISFLLSHIAGFIVAEVGLFTKRFRKKILAKPLVDF